MDVDKSKTPRIRNSETNKKLKKGEITVETSISYSDPYKSNSESICSDVKISVNGNHEYSVTVYWGISKHVRSETDEAHYLAESDTGLVTSSKKFENLEKDIKSITELLINDLFLEGDLYEYFAEYNIEVRTIDQADEDFARNMEFHQDYGKTMRDSVNE